MTKLERKGSCAKFADNYGHCTDNYGQSCVFFPATVLLRHRSLRFGHSNKLVRGAGMERILAGIGGDWRDLPPISAKTIWHGFSL